LEHWLFSHILEIITPTDFHIFQKGLKPPTSSILDPHKKKTMVALARSSIVFSEAWRAACEVAVAQRGALLAGECRTSCHSSGPGPTSVHHKFACLFFRFHQMSSLLFQNLLFWKFEVGFHQPPCKIHKWLRLMIVVNEPLINPYQFGLIAFRAAQSPYGEDSLGGKEEQLTLVKLGDRVQKTCKWRGEPAGEDALYAPWKSENRTTAFYPCWLMISNTTPYIYMCVYIYICVCVQ